MDLPDASISVQRRLAPNFRPPNVQRLQLYIVLYNFYFQEKTEVMILSFVKCASHTLIQLIKSCECNTYMMMSIICFFIAPYHHTIVSGQIFTHGFLFVYHLFLLQFNQQNISLLLCIIKKHMESFPSYKYMPTELNGLEIWKI